MNKLRTLYSGFIVLLQLGATSAFAQATGNSYGFNQGQSHSTYSLTSKPEVHLNMFDNTNSNADQYIFQSDIVDPLPAPPQRPVISLTGEKQSSYPGFRAISSFNKSLDLKKLSVDFNSFKMKLYENSPCHYASMFGYNQVFKNSSMITAPRHEYQIQLMFARSASMRCDQQQYEQRLDSVSLNSKVSDQENANEDCCPEEVPLCKISDIPSSCNLMENTINSDSENKTLYSLLSNISLRVSAQENESYKGQNNFCEKCYLDAYKQAYKKSSNPQKEFEQKEKELKSELAKQAVNQVYRKTLHMTMEQKLFYQKHKNTIDKVISDKNKKNEDVSSLDDLLCKNANNIKDVAKPDSCDGATESLQTFLEGLYPTQNKELKPNEIADAFSKEDQGRINKLFDNLSETLLVNLGPETKLKEQVEQEKMTLDIFSQDITKRIRDKAILIDAICSSDSLGENKQDDMDKIKEVLMSMSINGHELDIGRDQLNARLELFNQQIFMANLITPEIGIFTKDSIEFCNVAAQLKKDENKEKKFLDLVDKSLFENSNESGEADPTAKELSIFKHFENLASAGCNSPELKRQKVKLLCGDIKNTKLPLTYDFKNEKLDPASKMVLSKIQCSNNLNLIDVSEGASFNLDMTTDAIVTKLAGDNARSILLDIFGKSVEAGVDVITGGGDKLSDAEKKKKEEYKSATKTNEGSRNSSGNISYSNVVEEIKSSNGYSNYVKKNGRIIDPFSKEGIKEINSLSRSIATTPAESYNKTTDSFETNTVQKSESNYVRQGNEIYKNYKPETYPPVSTKDVENFLTYPPNSANPSDYSNLLNSIPGDKDQKMEQITNYINNPNDKSQFKDLDVDGNSDLQRQLDELRNQLLEEKQLSKSKELKRQLSEAQDELKRLTSAQNAWGSFSPNNSQAGGGFRQTLSGNADQFIDQLPKQNIGAVNNGSFLAPEINPASYNGIEKPRSLNGTAEFEKVLGSDNRSFRFDEENNKLVLKVSGKTVAVNFDNIEIEKGEIKSIVYAGKTYKLEQLVALGLDEKSIQALTNFARKGLKKKLATQAEEVLKLAGSHNIPIDSQYVDIPTYAHLLCMMDETHKSCQQK